MLRLLHLLILTTTLWTILAPKVCAQDLEVVTFRLPEGRQVGDSRCYNLGEFQELLRIDADLAAVQEALALSELALLEQEQVILNITRAHELASEQVELLQRERTRLREMWEEENRQRHEAQATPDLLGWVGWAAAAVAAATAVALGITLAVVQ